MQLILGIFEGHPPPAHLWEALSAEERATAVAILARLIAQSVVPEEEGDD